MPRRRPAVRQRREGRLASHGNGRLLTDVADVGVAVAIDDVAVRVALGRLASDGAGPAAAAARLSRVGRLQA